MPVTVTPKSTDGKIFSKEEAKVLLSQGGIPPKELDSILTEMDTDGSGNYNANEIYDEIGRLITKAKVQTSTINRLMKGIVMLGFLLMLSIVANFAVSFAAVEMSRKLSTNNEDGMPVSDTRKGELLMNKAGAHVVAKAAETIVDIKLLLVPSLPYDMLERIKTVEYLSDRTLHDAHVSGYSYVDESHATLYLATGVVLTIKEMAVYETKPGGVMTELPASALAGRLTAEGRRIDNEALTEIHEVMPLDCHKRLWFAPQMKLDRDAGKTTVMTRLADAYSEFRTKCAKDSPGASDAVCDPILDSIRKLITDEFTGEHWNGALDARSIPGRTFPSGKTSMQTDYWTWGGVSNNLDTTGTPGRDICVRAMELASPSSLGGMVEVGEGAYNSKEDKHLDIEDLWHMGGNVNWMKCRKAYQDGALSCPEDAIVKADVQTLL